MIVLLLPLLAFRALIPGGLMPVMSADGALSMQLCPGVIPAAVANGQHEFGAETGDSTHHDHDGTNGPASSHQTVCPYAILSTPACTSTAPAPATFTMRHALLASSDVAQATLPTLYRTQSPRAPPRYS